MPVEAPDMASPIFDDAFVNVAQRMYFGAVGRVRHYFAR